MDNLSSILYQRISRELQSILHLIKYWSDQSAYDVYAVGGFVRDLLMGRESFDIDLVVEGSAVDFAHGLSKLLPGKLTTYEKFGTATLAVPDRVYLDLVTARQEFYPSPGALPEVQQSTLKKDLFRRDFTINTLACDLTHNRFGRLYDYFGGQKDLHDGFIRTLYRLSFVDDPLRIIRALRFEQRFRFVLEEETRHSLEAAVAQRLLEKVSRDRLYGEIRQAFKERFPSRVLKRLKELGLWTYIFPRIPCDSAVLNKLRQVEQLMDKKYDTKRRRQLNLFIVYLPLLFQQLSPHDRNYIAYLMRLRRNERQKLFALLEMWPAAAEGIEKPNISNSELYFLLRDFPREGFPLLEGLSRAPEAGGRIDYYAERLSGVAPELSGQDLLEMGFKPGPIYNQLLRSLHEAVLDGKVKGRAEEMDYIYRLFSKGKETSNHSRKGES